MGSTRNLCFRQQANGLPFAKGKNQVWLIRANGKDGRSIPQEGIVDKFKWAPTSDRLAYVVNGELWVVEAEKDEPKRLVLGPKRKWEGVREFLWSPDEQSIAYEYQEKMDVPKDDWPWHTAINQVQTQTGAYTNLITIPPPNEEGVPGNIQLAAWRGSQKYFWQCEIMSASIMADGCPLYYLNSANQQKEVGVYSLLSPDFFAFTSDGRTLAISDGGGREAWTRKHLMLIHLDSGTQENLTSPKIAAISPCWSSDGSLLAYVAGPDIGVTTSDTSEGEIVEGVQKRRVWIVRADGTDARQLTDNKKYQEERPLFLAVKKHLIFARINNETGEASLWQIQNDGQGLEQVAVPISLPDESRTGYYGQNNWSEVFDCTCLKVER